MSRLSTVSLPTSLLQWILATLIFFTVGRMHTYYPFLAALSPGKLLFGAALLAAVINPDTIRIDNLWRAWPSKAVMALGALACLSIPFALSIGHAGSFFLNNYVKTLIIFFLLVVSIRDARDLHLYTWAYVLGCGFLVYLATFTFSLESTGTMQRLGDTGLGLDANDIGLVLTCGLPLAIVLFENNRGAKRWLPLVILVGIGVSLARTGSRGGLLGLIAVGSFLLVFMNRVSLLKRLGAVVAVVAGLTFMAPEGYWEQMRSMTEPTEDYNWQSPYGRKAIWERGVGYMVSHPLTGVGVGNFGRAEGTLSGIAQQREQAGEGYLWTAPHNSFIQIGAELGLLGLIVFCSLVFGGIGGLLRLRSRLSNRNRRARGPPDRFLHDLTTYLPVVLVGYAVTTFFLSFGYVDVTYIVFSYVAGVYVCGRKQAPSNARRRPAPRAGVPPRTGASSA